MVSGSLPTHIRDSCPKKGVKKPSFFMNGTADTRSEWEGDPNGNALPVQDAFDWLEDRNGCGANASSTRTVQGNGNIRADGEYYDCGGYPVEEWTGVNLEHCWPREGQECGGFDGPQLALEFWKKARS
jgi:poly(3-hydroxybutyrate) depolymerase